MRVPVITKSQINQTHIKGKTEQQQQQSGGRRRGDCHFVCSVWAVAKYKHEEEDSVQLKSGRKTAAAISTDERRMEFVPFLF